MFQIRIPGARPSLKGRATCVPCLAVALLVLMSSVSLAAPTGAVRLDRAAAPVDLDAVLLRTEDYQRERRLEHAPATSESRSAEVAKRLDAAQGHVGAPPGFFSRLAPGLWLSPRREQRLAAALAEMRAARTAAGEGRDAAILHLTGLADRLRGTPQAQETLSRLEAERARITARATALDQALADIAESLEDESGALGGRLADFWRRVRNRGAAAQLAELRRELASWGLGRGPGVLSADLTYVQGGLQAGPLPSGDITPAYLAAVDASYELEDTTQHREVELSPAVKAKAQALQTPKAAWDFVRNEMRLAWYSGSLKGATQTLLEGSGNDTDLAALLISLLRAQETPARFVEGVIELPVGKLADLLGLLQEEELQALYHPEAGAAPFELAPAKRDLALAALSGAGIPFEPVVEAGRIRAVRLTHTWVEAYLHVGDYRGAGAQRSGRQWVPLDPAIPGGPKYVATPPDLDVLGEMGTSAEQLTRDYLTSGVASSPLQFWRSRVEAFLAEKHPGVTYQDASRRVELEPEVLSLVPGALPYRVVSVHGEYAFLPDERKHRVRIRAEDSSGLFIDVTLPMHRVVGHRTVLTYKPASEADAAVISAAGGIYAAPASAVALLASLRVDGEEQAVATRPVGLGVRHRWSLELLLPDGSVRRVDNEVVAGNLVAIGFGGPRNLQEELAERPATDLDGPAPLFLYGRAAAYANAWTEAEEELARLTQVLPLRPTASLVLVENTLQVEEAFGVPQRVVWKGLQVDADFRTMVPLELVPGRGRALLRLSGYEGSYREAAVLTEGTGAEAVSAVTLLQEAYRTGTSVAEVRADNVDAELAQVSAPPEVLLDVRDLVARGREVLIPKSPLTVHDWTGTAFIARHPQTEEGGYFLSGRLSGGQTVISPGFWQEEELARRLESPDAPQATTDTSRVARIFKVAATDQQRAAVDRKLPQALAVYVTTMQGIPVKGAPVTFARAGKAKPLFGPPSAGAEFLTQETFVTQTDQYGRATVGVRLDSSVMGEAILEQPVGKPHPQLMGLNQVNAFTTSNGTRIELAFPFSAIGEPGHPARVVLNGPTRTVARSKIELGEDIQVSVVDAFDNPLANQQVTWTQSPATGAFVGPFGEASRVRTLGDGSTQEVSLTQVTPTLGTVAVGYIPGPAPTSTDFVLQASVPMDWTSPADDKISTEFTVTAKDAPDGVALFRLVTVAQESYNGPFTTPPLHHPTPFIGQVLVSRAGSHGSEWTALTGEESEYSEVSVVMDISDEAGNPVPGGHFVSEPWGQPNADPSFVPRPELPLETDPKAVVFYMPYLVQDGMQRVRFSARVFRTELAPGETEPHNRVENPGYFLNTFSRPVEVDVSRRTLTGEPASLSRCGTASITDLQLTVSIRNPASYPLYAEVTPQPTIAGQELVVIPPPEVAPRDAQGRLQLLRDSVTNLDLGVIPGTAGGTVLVRVFAPDPAVSSATMRMVDEHRIRIAPAGVQVADLAAHGALHASLFLPVRNVQAASDTSAADDLPIADPAKLEFCPSESGRVVVTSGGTVIAGANVLVGDDGSVSVSALPDMPDVPVLGLTEAGTLTTLVPPGDPQGQMVVIRLEPVDPASEPQTTELPLVTSVHDAGAFPVGHTFVKDVSVVDGHLVKQAEDLRVQGRGPALSFTRSYTSQGFEEGPMGFGWTHSLRSFVVPDQYRPNRYMVVGGEGEGQVFTCTTNGTSCRSQRGFHGTFHVEADAQGKALALVFRSKSGVVYRYGGLDGSRNPVRHPLLSVSDPAGSTLTFEYGGTTEDHEAVRVYEAGNRRFLQLTYTWPPGVRHTLLQTVELLENPAAPARLAADVDGRPLGVCVRFGYNGKGFLSRVERLDGSCKQGGPVVRAESFTYLERPWEGLDNNLETYTDPNGVTVSYGWYDGSDVLPGENAFLGFGDKRERVKEVKEPLGATTTFTYSLKPVPQAALGSVVQTYETSVRGPRPGIPATVYGVDGYGATTRVVRPLDEQSSAITSARWDQWHIKPSAEVDARGRTTRLKYDDFGNLIERRVQTPVLNQGGPATAPLVDGEGNPIPAVVERWAYDPAFSQPVCHIDPEGRVTLFELDSGGEDPRVRTPTGTGLLLRTRQLASQVDVARLAAESGDCLTLARGASTSSQDIVTERRYCGVNATSCPAGAFQGDLAQEIDGNGNVRSITRYEPVGLPGVETRPTSAGRGVTTTSRYDGRGRLEQQWDSQGHFLTQRFDALDRVTFSEHRNTKGTSPSLTRGWSYYPGGQLEEETNGTAGFMRTIALDGLNRPWRVTEKGGGLPAELTSRYGYDEAGNRTSETNRRGVTTTTRFDWGDRPVEKWVSVQPGEDASTFLAMGGEPGGVGKAGLIAAYGYDAAGNRLFETDVHGHRTDFTLDPLDRVVKVESSPVPGPALDAGEVRHAVQRRYDRTGNLLVEVDGNGHSTRQAYDFAGRRTRTEDAEGRFKEWRYDGNGNVQREVSGAGGRTHLERVAGYDGLNRPLQRTTTVAGITPATYQEAFQYDDGAHTVAVRDARGFVTVRELDDVDRVLSETQDADHPLRAPVSSGAGAALALTTRYEYDGNGNRTAVVDPLGRRRQDTVDALGRVTGRTLPMGVVETFTLDGEGNVIRHVDGRGIARETTWDAVGRKRKQRLIESISAGGGPLTVAEVAYQDELSGDGTVSVVTTDADGHASTEVLDAMHRVVRTVDALGHTSERRYDAADLRVTRDRRGFAVEMAYDGVHRLVSQAEEDLQGQTAFSQRFVFEDADRRVTAYDRRNVPTVEERDGLERVVRTRHSSGAEEQITLTEYDAAGNAVELTDANGHITRRTFDGAGRLVAETVGADSPVAATTSFKYDAAGNRTETKGPRTDTPFDLRVSYDDLNRDVRSEDALGNVTLRAFDAAGNRLCEKRPLGEPALGVGDAAGKTIQALEESACSGGYVTRHAYDEEGKLVSVLDALGGRTTFVYDSARNLVAKQDANGQLTTYEYDALHRRTAEYQHLDAHERLTLASRGAIPGAEPLDMQQGQGTLTWRWTHDEEGNARTVTDPKGQVATSTYGVLNRLERTEYSGHATPRELPSVDSIAYQHDGNGNVTHVTMQKATAAGPLSEVTERTFDSLDRLRDEKRYDGKHLTFEYDAEGNRTRVVDSDGVATSYTFDARERLETATMPEGTTTYAYWPDGLLKKVVHPNGVQEGHCYDAAGRLTTLVSAKGDVTASCATSGARLSEFIYAYDANGNRVRLDETRTAPGAGIQQAETTEYGFDGLDRLIGVKYPDGTAHLYRLDAVGNRTGERRSVKGAVAALTVAAFAALAPDQLTHDVSSVFNRADMLLSQSDAKDATRNLRFGWDANGNLTSKEKQGLSRELRWDIRNTLTAVLDNGQEVGRYDYDAELQRIRRRTQSERVEYVLDGAFVLQEADASLAGYPTRRRYHYGEGPLAVTDTPRAVALADGLAGATTNFLSTDALGSVSDVTSGTGEVVTARKYDAWGSYRDGTAPGAGDFKLGYTGHQYDVETGLTYARARYYDSELGLFISRDSYEGQLGDAPSLHRYAYAHGNPLRFTDRSGHAVNLVAAAIGAAGGALVGCAVGAMTDAGCGQGALMGAVGGGLAGLTMGGSLAAGAGVFSLEALTGATASTGVRVLATQAGAALVRAGGAVVLAETSADVVGVAISTPGCIAGDGASCAGVVAGTVDALTSVNLVGDAVIWGARGRRMSSAGAGEAPVTEVVEVPIGGTARTASHTGGDVPTEAVPSGDGPKLLPAKTATRQELEDRQIEDSNRDFRLTRANAETALTGSTGSTIEVAGSGGVGRDVTFRQPTATGVTVHRREVKAIAGGQSSFNDEVGHAAQQVKYDGNVFIQVPEGADALRMVLRFRGSRRLPEEKGLYRSVTTTIVDPSGNILFEGPLMP